MNVESLLPRRARPDEADAIAELYLRARRAAEPSIPPMVHTPAETRAWMTGQLEGSIGSEELAIWVVGGDDDALVAMMITEADWVQQLYVDPDHAGQGIGARLLDHAKALGPGTLQLWTFQSNVGARRFYERHGFASAERTDGTGNEEGAPDIRYVWTRTPFPATG